MSAGAIKREVEAKLRDKEAAAEELSSLPKTDVGDAVNIPPLQFTSRSASGEINLNLFEFNDD